jgi:hypothetical protein
MPPSRGYAEGHAAGQAAVCQLLHAAIIERATIEPERQTGRAQE